MEGETIMVSPYDRRTESIRNCMMGNKTDYTCNHLYRSEDGDFHYYINKLGYFHIVKPRRMKRYGVFSHYEVVDYMLTKDGKLKEVDNSGFFQNKKECMEKIETMVYRSRI